MTNQPGWSSVLDHLTRSMHSPLFLAGAQVMGGGGADGLARGFQQGAEFQAYQKRLQDEQRQREAMQQGIANLPGLSESDRTVLGSNPELGGSVLQDIYRSRFDPMAGLKKRRAELDIKNSEAELAARSRPAPPKYMEVNGRIVRVDPNGSAQEVYNAGPTSQANIPQGYTMTPQGTLEPIPGGPADKLTETESKDALFAERMLRAEKDLDAVIPIDETGKFKGYNPTTAATAAFPDTGVVANLFNSSEWQQYQRAARESLSAVLRKDTGAAVTPEEFNIYFPTYFPIPGDSPEVVLQKAQARRAAGIGLRGASSRAFNRMFPNFDAEMQGKGAPAESRRNDVSKPVNRAGAGRQRAVNRQTGEVVEFDGQNWVPAQ